MAECTSVLRTHDLSLSFGRFQAVDKLNLDVREGEIYGFLGRNGAGKTTTIRMLMGIVRPDAGQIELFSERMKRIGVKQKQRIGYVSQDQYFYPWMTCRGLGRFVGSFYSSWDRDEFQRLLDVLDLPPQRKISHLSGGMRVKLALAVALAHHPALLILDEPTSGLDPVARREFLDTIHRQARNHNRTTFFSSHLIDEVERVADRVGILHRGKLKYEGSIEQLEASVRRLKIDAHSDIVSNSISPETSAAELDDCPPEPATATEQIRSSILQAAREHGMEVLTFGVEEPDQVTLFGTPEQWESISFEQTVNVPLSLEDTFIHLVGEGTPDL